MHTRANIIDHSFAIPLCLYHGWNKTHELGRDFDKICAPMPWERGKKKKKERKGEKVSTLASKNFHALWLKKKKKNSDPLKWLFVFTSWYGFQKEKKIYLCHRIRMEWYYYKDCRKKKISRDSLLCSDFWKFHFKERYQFNPFNAD